MQRLLDDDYVPVDRFTNGKIYQWIHLPMERVVRYYLLLPETDRGLAPLTPAANRCHTEPSGYQHRDTIGGTSRGTRSAQARAKRFLKWTQNKKARRQDYRAWNVEDRFKRDHPADSRWIYPFTPI